MRKVVVVLLLAVFLLSTGSWAKAGRFSLGILSSTKSTGSLSANSIGYQVKFGINNNLDFEGRFQTGGVNNTSPQTTLSCLTGLLIYNFPVLSERFVPYIGGGFSQWTVLSGTGWSVTTGAPSYSCLTALGGINLYLTDQFSLYFDLGRETINTTPVTGVSVGANYTF